MSSRLLGYSLLLVLVAALTLPNIAPSQQPARNPTIVPRWEYKVVRGEGDLCASEGALNSLGREGWELVSYERLSPPLPREADGTLLIAPAATGPSQNVNPPTADSFQGTIIMKMGQVQPGVCTMVFKRQWLSRAQP